MYFHHFFETKAYLALALEPRLMHLMGIQRLQCRRNRGTDRRVMSETNIFTSPNLILYVLSYLGRVLLIARFGHLAGPHSRRLWVRIKWCHSLYLMVTFVAIMKGV